MTDSPTIKGMKATELKELCLQIVDKIKQIDEAHTRIADMQKKVKEMHDSVVNLNAKQELSNVIADAGKLLQTIKSYHSQVFDGDEESGESSIQEQISDLIQLLAAHKNEFDDLKKSMLGGFSKDEEGKKHKTLGYIREIQKKFEGYEAQYQKMYQRIDGVLLSGATTVALAKHFNTKVKEYSQARKRWERMLFLLFVVGFVGLSVAAIFFPYSGEWREWIPLLLRQVPFISLFVWAVFLVGNRRAENQKLEESYKHKEVMAQSFTGYRKSIEEISTKDTELLQTLMRDLLDAIKQDSSAFLSAKGENHPVADATNKGIQMSTIEDRK